MSMLIHAHSGLRWLVLVFLLLAIVTAFGQMRSGKAPGVKWHLFALITTHIQLVLGLILYFTSAKVVFNKYTMENPTFRFFTVEHLTLMLLAIVLITVGYSRAKRAKSVNLAGRSVFLFYLVGLVLILAGIPWPMRDLGAGWF